MKDLKETLERLAAFAVAVLEFLLRLPELAVSLVGAVVNAAYAGLFSGVVAGAVTWFATGKPFTSFLLGALWAGLHASYVMLVTLAGGGEGEEAP